jgi:hypothetical protein
VSICRCKRVKYWRNWLKERERQQRYCFHFHFRNNLFSNSGNWLAGWLAALFAFLLKIRISCCSCSNLSLVAFEWTVFDNTELLTIKNFKMDLRGKYITTVRPTDNRLTDECLTTIHVPAGFLFNTQISISFHLLLLSTKIPTQYKYYMHKIFKSQAMAFLQSIHKSSQLKHINWWKEVLNKLILRQISQ